MVVTPIDWNFSFSSSGTFNYLIGWFIGHTRINLHCVEYERISFYYSAREGAYCDDAVEFLSMGKNDTIDADEIDVHYSWTCQCGYEVFFLNYFIFRKQFRS